MSAASTTTANCANFGTEVGFGNRRRALRLNDQVMQKSRDFWPVKTALHLWHRPKDVAKIVRRWNTQEYQGGGWNPTDAEMARVHEYLADPGAHSIVPRRAA